VENEAVNVNSFINLLAGVLVLCAALVPIFYAVVSGADTDEKKRSLKLNFTVYGRLFLMVAGTIAIVFDIYNLGAALYLFAWFFLIFDFVSSEGPATRKEILDLTVTTSIVLLMLVLVIVYKVTSILYL